MLGAVTALLPPLDLSALLQYVVTALLLGFGFLVLLKNAASRYFVVDTGFDSVGYAQGRATPMSIGRGGGGDGDGDGGGGGGGGGDRKCFVCGKDGSKTCGRCRSVRYCSLDCQSQHWKADHKSKCRKKESGLVALVPGRGVVKVLQQPKKILFPYDEFRNLYYWDKRVFPPCGLLNCGNSCFANVVLQCLSCTRPLAGYLLEAVHSRQCRRIDWCLLCELQSHVQRVSQSSRPFSPRNILSQLTSIGCHLGYGRQEDAHEFMRFAIDTMQSVCLDEFGGEKVLDPSSQETSIIQHIFGGLLQSQVICTKCNVVSNRYENMMDLTVEIQGDAESLEDCLIQFTAKEWLDGENMYKCDGCNDYVKALKQLTVHRPPNILTVTLKRFQSGRFGKLNKRVAFPETLDLGPYMSCNGEGDNLYRLYAVVVHLDMLNASFFGHYICYTKDFSGNWYRVDDCKVTNVELQEVLSQGAYMLLYSRLHVHQPKPLPTTEENVFQQEQDPVNFMGTVIRNNISINSDIDSENQGKKDVAVDDCMTSFLDNSYHNLKKIEKDISEEDSLPLKELAERKISTTSSDENKRVEPQLPLQKSQEDCILLGQNESTCNFRQGNEVPDTNEMVHASDVSTFSLRSTEKSREVVNPSLTHFSVGSKLDQTIENHSSNVSEGLYNNKRAKAPPEISGSSMCREEAKPFFSRGFLDKPSRKKPMHQARKVQTKNDAVGPFMGNGLSEVEHYLCGNAKPMVPSNILDKDVDIEGTGQTKNGGLNNHKDVNSLSNCPACVTVKQSLCDQKSCQKLTTSTPIHPCGEPPTAVHRSDLQDNGYCSSGRTSSTETCQSKEFECVPEGHNAYEGPICDNSERIFPEKGPLLRSNGLEFQNDVHLERTCKEINYTSSRNKSLEDSQSKEPESIQADFLDLKGCKSSVPEICNGSLSDISMPVFSQDFRSVSNKSCSLSIEANLSGRPSMKVTSSESEQGHQNHDACQDSLCASGMNGLSNLNVFYTHEPPNKQ